jgi:outer membrane receptor protein involved in Fe transport
MLSRLIFGFHHTWRLQDEILIRPGVPELDLLDGSALNSRGGQPRHELEFQAGAFQRGLGARLTASWRSGTTVRGVPGGAGGNAGDLTFSDVALINLRLFVDLGQRLGVAKYPWLRGARLSVGVDNLLDSRVKVRDAAGGTPFSYQPTFLDPLGRSVNISLRKTFF